MDTEARKVTKSKRTIHEVPFAPLGSLKSLRHQPIQPRMLPTDSSVAFHAYGTVTSVHALWVLRRNSHGPSSRERLVWPLAEGAPGAGVVTGAATAGAAPTAMAAAATMAVATRFKKWQG